MQLTKVNGNTYYIPSSTNTGVFQFKDRYTLLVDSGGDNQQARRICDTLQENDLSAKYLLLTHSHNDHSGGHAAIRERFPGCQLAAHTDSAVYLANPPLFPQYIFGGKPPAILSRPLLFKPAMPEILANAGTIRLNDEKFTIMELPGHAPGQCGILTRDRVCFIGDSLFSREILQKYSFPFLHNIEAQFLTLDTIATIEADFFILGHGPEIYDQSQINELINLNRANLQRYLAMIMDLLDQPKSREELLEELIILNELNPDVQEYYFISSTLAAMFSYLQPKENLVMQVENGRLYFFKPI